LRRVWPNGYDASRGWKLRRKLSFLTVGLLLGLVTVVATLFVVTYRSIDERSVRDETRSADVIIVLGAAVWPDEQPGPSLRARTERAVELYHDGFASHLILSGGLGRFPPEEAEVMRRLAVEAGIPSEALVLEKEAHSTWESMVYSREIMQERGWHTALIVSDPFHMRRSLLVAEAIGLRAYASPALNSPTHSSLPRRLFYTSREVLALWWYLVRHIGKGI
jgi:uncharacterized SAM-binding protein YcdF (DUF218 family)